MPTILTREEWRKEKNDCQRKIDALLEISQKREREATKNEYLGYELLCLICAILVITLGSSSNLFRYLLVMSIAGAF